MYPLNEHFGIIVLRTKDLDSEKMTGLLLRYLRETGDTDFEGTLYVIENKKYRRRSKRMNFGDNP